MTFSDFELPQIRARRAGRQRWARSVLLGRREPGRVQEESELPHSREVPKVNGSVG